MNQLVGRGENRGWSTKWPVSSLGALVLGVVAGIGIFTYRTVEVWTPLQRWYWIQYLNTKNFPSPRDDYQVLAKVDRHGQRRMAVDADVMAGAPQGRQLIPFALSQQAKQAGGRGPGVGTGGFS